MLTLGLFSFVLTTLTAAAPAPEMINSPGNPDLLLDCYGPGTIVLQKEHCKAALQNFTMKHFGPLQPDATFTKDADQARQPGYILAGDPIANEECILEFGVVSLDGPACSVALRPLIDRANAVIDGCIVEGDYNGGVSYLKTNKPPSTCHVSVHVSPFRRVADEQRVNDLINQAASNHAAAVAAAAAASQEQRPVVRPAGTS